MMKSKKKFASVAMAAVMLASAAIPASAATVTYKFTKATPHNPHIQIG